MEELLKCKGHLGITNKQGHCFENMKEKEKKILEGDCIKLQIPNKNVETCNKILDAYQKDAICYQIYGYFSWKVFI